MDDEDKPLTVSKSGVDERNIILWMDHRYAWIIISFEFIICKRKGFQTVSSLRLFLSFRAVKEAEDINKTHHKVLSYVGT